MPTQVFEAFERSDRFAHPWLRCAPKSLPGKWFHVHSSAVALPFYEPYAQEDAPDSLHPVFSQPVFELFYRVPMATLIQGGWDRAIVRRAFTDILPPQIVRRRGKGSSTTT